MALGKKSKVITATPVESAATPSPFPLFYKSPSVLDATRHARATVSTMADYGFAKATNSVPLNGIEFIEAAKNYPIVFTGADKIMPAVVLGLEQANYFVKADGNWLEENYIPAYVRQYPFIFFEQPQQERFYLCIDEASDNFHAEGDPHGTAIYEADGTPTALTSHALEFCTSFYQHHMITQNMCADLVKHKLLMPFQSEVKLKNGKEFNLSGFQMIDENAFNALTDDVFLEFRQKGWLAFIYFALASTGNWKKLINLA